MTQYDPTIIQQFVDRLYKKANGIILSHALLGVLVGGLGGFMVGSAAHLTPGLNHGTVTLGLSAIGALLLGAFGHSLGTAKAFHLKLTAQTALCQVQIEANTRQAAGNAGEPLHPDAGRRAA